MIMNNSVLLSLKKRRDKFYEFYYRSYGQIIRKKRMELKYTQEYLASAICSNTYISKAENNQVAIGEDQLMLIMERLDISPNQYAKPETLIYFIKKTIRYYYFRDIDAYKKIIDKVEAYDFHAVIELIKLGYQILTKQEDEALSTHKMLLSYLSSLDDLAFQVFLIFGAEINMKFHKYDVAKDLIESSFATFYDYPELNVLIDYTKYKAYSRLHMHNGSAKLFHKLMIDFSHMGNMELMSEIMMINAINKETAKEQTHFRHLEYLLKHVDEELVNEYLLVKAINEDNPRHYVEKMPTQNSMAYLIGQYLIAKQSMKRKQDMSFKRLKESIGDLGRKLDSVIDFEYLLDLEEQGDLLKLKEYLVNPCLREAVQKQDIYLMDKTTKEIVDILKERNRYKDGLTYTAKLENDIYKLRN